MSHLDVYANFTPFRGECMPIEFIFVARCSECDAKVLVEVDRNGKSQQEKEKRIYCEDCIKGELK